MQSDQPPTSAALPPQRMIITGTIRSSGGVSSAVWTVAHRLLPIVTHHQQSSTSITKHIVASQCR
jgi:hypothetical protein